MKLKIISFFLLFSIANASAQKAYLIHDFMKGYTLYFIQQKIGSETKEYYKLADDKSKKTVLEFGAKELAKPQIIKTAQTIAFKSLSNSNIQVLGDVNFDEREDIVVNNPEIIDDEGCYNPTKIAHIFINSPATFTESQSISNVYNSAYCLRGGSFEIDAKYKRLITCSSGGAANHSCEHYSVLGKEAKMISSFEEDGFAQGPFSKITGKKLENSKWISFNSLSIYEPNLDPDKVLAFDTKNGKGRILLFNSDNILYYAFKQNDEYNFISFAHPSSPEKAGKATFKFRKQNAGYELEFNSGSIKYLVYETSTGVGIKINVNGKISDWQGMTKEGSLETLVKNKFVNVTND
ncbi:XAC2610-related protein [Flavobacterium procerum]|uniref:XAC2610-related protein n=1 Tax=Flavobacterium procerum TaxID=1455569 RepID=A0ABV6BN42_9FLAO